MTPQAGFNVQRINEDFEILNNNHKDKVKMADTACCVRHFFENQ
jgi:hypothetical protein